MTTSTFSFSEIMSSEMMVTVLRIHWFHHQDKQDMTERLSGYGNRNAPQLMGP